MNELANKLVEAVDNELWESIVPTAWDDSGLDIILNKERLKAAILKVLNAGTV